MIIDLINVQALGWCIILENIQLLFGQNDFKGSFYAVAIGSELIGQCILIGYIRYIDIS